MGHALAKAIEWLEAGGWEHLSDGKYEILGNQIYALVSHYNSKLPQEARFETHRNYIDIQLVVSGSEFLEVRNAQGLSVSEPYKPDIEFYSTPSARTCHEMLLEPGVALILYPEDAHRPGIAIDGVPKPVHKLVVKVAVD